MKGNQGFNIEFIRFEILVKYKEEITGYNERKGSED